MIRIYKYELTEAHTEIIAPILQVLDIQIQEGRPVMWALVNTDSELKKTVNVRMFWTGQSIDTNLLKEYKYFKTLQDGMGLVWHAFIQKY